MMYEMYRILFPVFFFVLILFSPQHVYAAYGDGGFGENEYNGSDPTSTPAPTSSPGNSGSSGSSSSSGSERCNAQSPNTSPDLFQVDRRADSATLYFTPVGKPYTHYYILYGYSPGDARYNVRYDISNSSGAIEYSVHALDPNVGYYFSVKAANGCAVGPKSAAVFTEPVGGGGIIQFFPEAPSVVKRVTNFFQDVRYTFVSPPSEPSTEKEINEPKNEKPAQIVSTKTSSPAITEEKSSGGIWGWIKSLFGF